MAITPLPTPPSRQSPATFSSQADAFLSALPGFVTETNALAADIFGETAAAAAAAAAAGTDAADAALAAASAEASAVAAAAAANAVKWVSGTAYAEGDVVWSPIDHLSYRRTSAGAGATDPSLDPSNWQLIAPPPTASTGEIDAGTETAPRSVSPSLIKRAVDVFSNQIIYQEFTTSGTWTKPPGAKWVYIEAVGGGAGGSNSTFGNVLGGGGGAGLNLLLRAADCAATEIITIGAGGVGAPAGGSTGAPGGSTTFGILCVAPGGDSSGTGGGGEGTSAGAGGGGTSSGAGGYSSGRGGNCIIGGGGGGGASTSSSSAGLGGISVRGGNGGNGTVAASAKAQDGQAPGGGGGAAGGNGGGGNGAAGRLRVWTII